MAKKLLKNNLPPKRVNFLAIDIKDIQKAILC